MRSSGAFIENTNTENSACEAVLGGYESLVGQVQLLPSTLVTGDSGGKLRHWNLADIVEIYQIHAHDSSVTSVAATEAFIVSGGSDGAAKVWVVGTGVMIKKLVVSDAVWKVGLSEQRIVAVFSMDGEVHLQVSRVRPEMARFRRGRSLR